MPDSRGRVWERLHAKFIGLQPEIADDARAFLMFAQREILNDETTAAYITADDIEDSAEPEGTMPD
jgi:hypothetical protein